MVHVAPPRLRRPHRCGRWRIVDAATRGTGSNVGATGVGFSTLRSWLIRPGTALFSSKGAELFRASDGVAEHTGCPERGGPAGLAASGGTSTSSTGRASGGRLPASLEVPSTSSCAVRLSASETGTARHVARSPSVPQNSQQFSACANGSGARGGQPGERCALAGPLARRRHAHSPRQG